MGYSLFRFLVMPFYEEKNDSFKNKKSMKRRGGVRCRSVILLASETQNNPKNRSVVLPFREETVLVLNNRKRRSGYLLVVLFFLGFF